MCYCGGEGGERQGIGVDLKTEYIGACFSVLYGGVFIPNALSPLSQNILYTIY